MEISLLKMLLNNITRFVSFSARGDKCSGIVDNCCVKIEEVVKLVKPVLECVVDDEVASDEVLQKEFEGMSRCVDEVMAVFEECHPLMSKVYFVSLLAIMVVFVCVEVLKVESLFAKVQTHGLEIFDRLQSCEGLPVELSSASLEHCVQKIKHMGFEKLSANVSKAIRVQVEGSDPSSDLTSKIADLLSLKSNKELLIELVALENLKESAEQAEKNGEVEYIEEMIALVTHMHDCFVEMKQSQSSYPVPIPPDFSFVTGQLAPPHRILIFNHPLSQTDLSSSTICHFHHHVLRTRLQQLSVGKICLLRKEVSKFLGGRIDINQKSAHRRSSSGAMEIPLLELFLKNISSFLRLSCKDNTSFDIVEKYYIKIEELLKLIKPVLESVIDVEVASHESLQKEFADMSQSVNNLRKVLEDCHPLMSKVYFVLKVESLFAKIHTHGLNIIDLLQSCEGLPVEPSSPSLKKIKHMGHEKPLDIVSRAIIDEDHSSDITSQIADLLSLSSNQELLIELVALETIKESAEQAEYIEEMISLVTHMHDRFIEMKQSQNNNSIPIPPDLCCPLSLELMTDPVIVSSGQTYERAMEIPLLELFLKNISSFLRLSCKDNTSFDIVEKYYIKIEELLKLIKPVLESVIDVEVASHESLQKEFTDMSQSVNNLRKVLEDCHPLMSKVYFVLKVESLFAKIHTHGLNIIDLLQSCEGLPVEPSSPSLKKIKHMGHEKPLDIVSRAIIDEDHSSDITSQIADLLSLSSNQELLIELVALETIKESAEQAEYIEEMISLVTHMHDRFIEMKQSQNNNSIPIPPDLCCPLSLELMTDPVIVSSGQTYEREYITNWINLGLTICPKTMQIFVHANLTPNYAVRALIANWCESNNVPDPVKASLVHQAVTSFKDESLLQALITTTTDASEEVSTQAQPTIRNVSMSRSQTFRSTRVCSVIEARVKKLVEDLNSTSLEVVKNATSELRVRLVYNWV
ncbi:zinc finger, RING/FYVE/PHD-type, Armadillo-type fold protein [Artemisia annua]|uniref:Zinc finger, RING/FYVE/PHD-type, Armadillo-type fold protein n=1 Tax=Artemisia annua TaxID=35608 RepID=A0A2U1KB64_ARTAN|nr:zinc finger, RING/FYVE/PHD-type, Armadillo-type fold protein [Artemisia annua]